MTGPVMTLLQHFRRMAGNNRWSNDRIHAAVADLKPGEFEARRIGYFPSIAETLNHILMVDLYYIDSMKGNTRAGMIFDSYHPYTDRARLAAAQADSDARLLAFCNGLEVWDLDRVVMTDRRPSPVAERVGDLIAHLFIHQIHHRGQVHSMLSGTSVSPPQLDEFFLSYDLQARKDEMSRLALPEGR